MLSSAPRAAFLPLLMLTAACADPPAPAPSPPVSPAPQAATALPVVPGACAASSDAVDAGAPEDPESVDDRRAHATPDDPKNLCAVADSNLKRAGDAILAAPRGRPGEVPASAWDRKTAPARLDLVAKRFALGRAEQATLAKNGFVVPARLTFPSYAAAFHEIYQSEMPIYVSVDSVLHAVFRGNDQIVARIESRRLAPLLGRTLDAMHCALPGAAAGYPEETARDLDVYLTVARSLLADKPVPAVFQGDAEPAAALVKAAHEASGMADVELFGRPRKIDWSAYTPRGHYASEESLKPYFRSTMWISRLEYNLVSRSSRSSAASPDADPRETPREAVDALALAELADKAGAMEGVRAMDRAWATFGGKREDVSLDQLNALRGKAAIASLREPQVFERLKEVVGGGFVRTTKLHYMPDGTSALPVIATMLGPRLVADTAATQPLVEPQTPERHVISALEMGYALGQDRARAYLGKELGKFPSLGARLDEARAIVHAPSTGEDLYGVWLRAVEGLAERPRGELPSFMRGEAFADMRLGTTIAAFAQLRHNAVLFAGQGYDQGGCEIPDGFVEPAPATYDALIAYAERGASAVASIDPRDEARARGYFGSLARVLRILAAIGQDELSGRPLSEEERRFLSMVLEMTPGSSGGGPTYTGWYFDLFPSRDDALARADFIADYFTSGYEGVISYAGATAPRLGVFVVDTGGGPRAVVGPVARAYEHHGPLAKRLDDEAASKLVNVDDPWAVSYAMAAPKEPELTFSWAGYDEKRKVISAVVEAPRAVGVVTVEALDHHRRVIQAVTQPVRAGKTTFVFRKVADVSLVEAVHVQAGEAHAWAEVGGMEGPYIALGQKVDGQ